eukprot:95047-Prorocentrum_minimum.AAC.2
MTNQGQKAGFLQLEIPGVFSLHTPCPSTTSKVDPSLETNPSRCVVQYLRGTHVQNASYQRCEHPGFPGASSVCNVRVPWTNPSPV